jgi:hypothetical protein
MLIYDIEIRNAIPDRRAPKTDGFTYCNGWQDFRGMGIAVIGCFDYATDRPRIFCGDNLQDFGRLIESQDCIVGFNNHRFDDRILEAHGLTIPLEKSYDILAEVWHALGLGPVFQPETHGGYGLEALARANFSYSPKPFNGADAPLLWQRGEIGKVIDYCLHDIHLTKRLLDRIIRMGVLANPKDRARTIYLRKPGAQQ